MPIHSHCEFSLFDGFGHPEDHAQAAIDQGLPGLCVTDHRSVSGWYRWESAFKKAGVAPLFGIESYFSPNRHEKTKENIHLVLIAKSEAGLSSINRIATGAALEGNYANRHRCDWELLKENSEGVICTTACVSGPVGYFLKESNDSEAKDRARDWLLKAQDIFGDDLYLELQPHPFDDQWALNEFLCDYSKVMGLKLLTSNDSHYPRPEDRPIHDVAVCISTKKNVNDKKRIRYEHDFSVKGFERLFDELQSLGRVPMGCASEAVENTRELLCNVRVALPKGLPLHPAFEDATQAFKTAVNQGRRRRIFSGKYPYGTEEQGAYDERLRQEVELLRAKNFDEYFLVTNDIVERAKDAGVMVGPGRGSSGGSIVAYVLGITEVDPVKFGLSFERFVSRNRGGYLMDLGYSSEDIIKFERLYRDSYVYEHYGKDLRWFLKDNRIEERDLSIEWRVEEELDHIGWQELEEFYLGLAVTKQKVDVDRYYIAYLIGITDKFDPDQMPPLAPDLPDIDLDFSDRASVVDLLRKRWGEDKVANIANYSELGVKDALERTSKAMGVPLPTGLKEEIHDHYASIADYLSSAQVEDEDLKQCLEYASRFEGCVHHLGRTAAGVIVSSVPVTNYVPMTRAENARVIAAYDKRDSEAIGFVKMDILEVSNLTILQLAQRIAKERGENPVDPWEVPLDDRNALKVFERGDTDLIFQFGQRAMKNLLARMKPKTFEEVYAASALVRGGADDNVYIQRKNNPEEVERLRKSLHSDVEEILRSSYYVLLYQEQAMRLCHEVGQMSYRNTNRVRKLAAKKEDTKELDTLGEVFVSGAINHGLKEEDARDLWKSIRRQSRYSFNLSHSVGYSMISMANAYYQVYHPLAWAIANLTVNGEDYEKRDPIINFCKRAGIKMCEPSINDSDVQWSFKDERLFPGFTSIKGIGDSLANKIIKERDENGSYVNGEDLLKRLKGKGFGPAKLKMLEAEGAVPNAPGDPLKLSIYRGEKLSLLDGMNLHPYYSIVTVGEVRDFACSFVELYVTHCKKSGAVYNISYYSGEASGMALSGVKLGVGSYIAILHRYGLDRIYAAVPFSDINDPKTRRKGYGGHEAFAKHPFAKEFSHRVLEIPPKRDLVSMVPRMDLDLKNQGLRPVTGLAYVLKTQKHRLRSGYTVNATPVFTRQGPRVINMRSPIEKEGYYMVGYGYAEGERLDHKVWLAKSYEEVLQPKLAGLDKEVA